MDMSILGGSGMQRAEVGAERYRRTEGEEEKERGDEARPNKVART